MWRSVKEELPPNGLPVKTRIYDRKGERNVQTLIRRGSLWFINDMNMFVHYVPTDWKYLYE